MSTLSNPEVDLDTVNPDTVTIPDLISALRFAFQPEDYKKVEDILVAREKKLLEKYDSEERAHSLAQLNYIVADDELTKLKKEMRVKSEEVTRLKEEKKLFEERDKRVRAESDKLFGENVKLVKEVKELKSALESAKLKAEKEHEENDLRITRLEKEVEELMMSGPILQPKVEKEDIADANGAPGGTRSGNSSVDTNMVGPSEAGAGFVIRPCGEGDSSHKAKRQKINTEYINISDSDDNIQRQAQTPNLPSVVAVPDLSLKEKPTKTSTSEQPGCGNRTPNVPRVTVPVVSLKEEETKASASVRFDGGNQCSGSNGKREPFLDNVERENDNDNFDVLFASSSDSDSDCDSDTFRRLLKL